MRAGRCEQNFFDTKFFFEKLMTLSRKTPVAGNVANLKGLGNISKLISDKPRAIEGYTKRRHLPHGASEDHRWNQSSADRVVNPHL
jgi:hypothetical protein